MEKKHRIRHVEGQAPSAPRFLIALNEMAMPGHLYVLQTRTPKVLAVLQPAEASTHGVRRDGADAWGILFAGQRMELVVIDRDGLEDDKLDKVMRRMCDWARAHG